MENAYEGGSPSSITLKYGQLIINLNGQVFGEIGDLCNEMKDESKVNDNIQFDSEKTQ